MYYFTEVLEVCTSNTLLTTETGIFTSLDTDNDGLYDFNLDCVWIIEAGEDEFVKMNIQSIDIQEDDVCRYDFLEVHFCYVFIQF